MDKQMAEARQVADETRSISNWFPLIASVAAVVLAVFSTGKYGAGLSPDSVWYIAAARSLASGNGFTDWGGGSIVVWPPLYSASMALFQVGLDMDPMVSAGIVNAIAFGAIVLASCLMAKRLLGSLPVAYTLLSYLLILLSFPLLDIASMAWSDSLFIALTLAFLMSTWSFVQTRSASYFVFMILGAAAATLVRYLGLTLILTGAVVVLMMYRASLRQRLAHTALFALLSMTPIAVWVARNYVVSGTLIGSRGEANSTPIESLATGSGTLLRWFAPWLPLLLCLAVVASFGRFNLKQYWARLQEVGPSLKLLTIFTTIYLGTMVFSILMTGYNLADSRYLSPVYIPLLLITMALLANVLEQLRRNLSGPNFNRLRFTAFSLLLVYSIVMTSYIMAYHVVVGGGGYNTVPWRESEVVKYLQEETGYLQDSEVYSNGPDAAYILTGLEARYLPARNGSGNDTGTAWLEGLKANSTQSEVYILWFDLIGREHLLRVDELASMADLDSVQQFRDGAIYRLDLATVR